MPLIRVVAILPKENSAKCVCGKEVSIACRWTNGNDERGFFCANCKPSWFDKWDEVEHYRLREKSPLDNHTENCSSCAIRKDGGEWWINR